MTFPDAREYFEMVRDLDVDYYGFKVIRLPEKVDAGKYFCKECGIPVVFAGSPNSFERLQDPVDQGVGLGFF